MRQSANERCACGSGKKYKRCCGLAEQPKAPQGAGVDLAALDQRLNEAVSRAVPAAIKAIQGGDAPPFITIDEKLWLLALGDELLKPVAESPENGRQERMAAALETFGERVHQEFGTTLSQRLLGFREHFDESKWPMLEALFLAVTGEPESVMVAAMAAPAVYIRDCEREALPAFVAHEWKSREAFEAYVAHLESAGEHLAAERMRTVVPRLQQAGALPAFP